MNFTLSYSCTLSEAIIEPHISYLPFVFLIQFVLWFHFIYLIHTNFIWYQSKILSIDFWFSRSFKSFWIPIFDSKIFCTFDLENLFWSTVLIRFCISFDKSSVPWSFFRKIHSLDSSFWSFLSFLSIHQWRTSTWIRWPISTIF